MLNRDKKNEKRSKADCRYITHAMSVRYKRHLHDANDLNKKRRKKKGKKKITTAPNDGVEKEI